MIPTNIKNLRAGAATCTRVEADIGTPKIVTLASFQAVCTPLGRRRESCWYDIALVWRRLRPLILVRRGPIGYGTRTGLLGAPARAAQAAAPLLFGVLLDELGEYALIISGGLSVLALIALLGLRAKAPHTV
jgi:hypothetical protein